VLGVLRLGALVNFLSHSVISGFTSAAALVIGFEPGPRALGVDAERSRVLRRHDHRRRRQPRTANPVTVAIGALQRRRARGRPRLAPRFPVPLLVVATATVATARSVSPTGVAILGEVPAGLPMPALPSISVGDVVALLPSALAIALISYVEGISVAKAIAAKTRQPIDANAELIAAGGRTSPPGCSRPSPSPAGSRAPPSTTRPARARRWRPSSPPGSSR
jgi:sulfate permease, SulP family